MSGPGSTAGPRPRLGLAGAITKATIRSPLTPLGLLAALAVGLMALSAIPREEEPQISVPMVDVRLSAPGLSAAETVEAVTRPVELALKGLDGVEHVYSRSEDDGALVTARFDVGTAPEDAAVRVSTKLAEPGIAPPALAADPQVTVKGVDDVPVLVVTLSATPDMQDRWTDAALHQVAEDLEAEIAKVAGVGSTFLVGGRPLELRVAPDPARLAAFGVHLPALIEAVGAAGRATPLGANPVAGRSLDVVAGARPTGVADVEALGVRDVDGAVVSVKDVADVALVPRDDGVRAWAIRKQGEAWSQVPAVAIAVAKRPGVNAVDMTRAVRATVARAQGDLIPAGLRAEIVRDHGETAKEKADELLFHLGLATLSIVLLIFLAIGKREALVTLVVIPTTILLTLFAAHLMGYTINRVSLFALIFSIGILVDDAIVVIENIARHWAMGDDRPAVDAAVDAVAEVGNPTIVATLTVVVGLLPMMAVSGLMGPYMAPIPANASAAMVFSFFVAVAIAPWLMVLVAPKAAAAAALAGHGHGHAEGVLGGLYRRVATPIIASKRSAWTFLLAVGAATLLAMSAFAFKIVPVKLLPFDDKSEFQVVLDMPEGATLEATQRVLFDAARVLGGAPEVIGMEAYAGAAAPFNFNGLVRHYYLRDRPETGDLQVNLAPSHARDRASHAIALDARKKLAALALPPGASLKIVETPPGPPVLATLLAEVYGPDAQTRRAVAAQVRALMDANPSIVDVDDGFGQPRPRTAMVTDRARLEALDVSEAHVAGALGAAMGGVSLGHLSRPGDGDPVAIRLRLPETARVWSGGLSALPVAATLDETGAPRLVALSEVASARETQGSHPLFRRDGRFAEMVTAELAGRFEAPIYGILDMNAAIKAHDWGAAGPPVVRLHGQPEDERHATILWDGEWEITWVTFRDMGAAFGVALVGIYILVVAQFGSFRLPLVVLTPIPLTLIGIVVGHALFAAPFSATSMIGFIALAGIIVRNSILLIDFIRHARAPGRALTDVLLEAGAIRFKPILLTALAAMIGAAVILTDPIFQGLAISLLFGLLSSTLLTVLVIPAIYVALRGEEVEAPPAA
jgi:multidrug efflux pump subunit AcrB